MDSRQIELVQQSHALAARFSAHVAATFYAELFAMEPSLRQLFTGDMIVQGQKLMDMLKLVVAGLSEPLAIQPALRELGTRHIDYGVLPHHYDLVGTALIRTLRHELGGAFTPDVRAAWVAAYQFISDTMREGYPAAERRA